MRISQVQPTHCRSDASIAAGGADARGAISVTFTSTATNGRPGVQTHRLTAHSTAGKIIGFNFDSAGGSGYGIFGALHRVNPFALPSVFDDVPPEVGSLGCDDGLSLGGFPLSHAVRGRRRDQPDRGPHDAVGGVHLQRHGAADEFPRVRPARDPVRKRLAKGSSRPKRPRGTSSRTSIGRMSRNPRPSSAWRPAWAGSWRRGGRDANPTARAKENLGQKVSWIFGHFRGRMNPTASALVSRTSRPNTGRDPGNREPVRGKAA
jgi:hypothetical protein